MEYRHASHSLIPATPLNIYTPHRNNAAEET